MGSTFLCRAKECNNMHIFLKRMGAQIGQKHNRKWLSISEEHYVRKINRNIAGLMNLSKFLRKWALNYCHQ